MSADTTMAIARINEKWYTQMIQCAENWVLEDVICDDWDAYDCEADVYERAIDECSREYAEHGIKLMGEFDLVLDADKRTISGKIS